MVSLDGPTGTMIGKRLGKVQLTMQKTGVAEVQDRRCWKNL